MSLEDSREHLDFNTRGTVLTDQLPYSEIKQFILPSCLFPESVSIEQQVIIRRLLCYYLPGLRILHRYYSIPIANRRYKKVDANKRHPASQSKAAMIGIEQSSNHSLHGHSARYSRSRPLISSRIQPSEFRLAFNRRDTMDNGLVPLSSLPECFREMGVHANDREILGAVILCNPEALIRDQRNTTHSRFDFENCSVLPSWSFLSFSQAFHVLEYISVNNMHSRKTNRRPSPARSNTVTTTFVESNVSFLFLFSSLFS